MQWFVKVVVSGLVVVCITLTVTMESYPGNASELIPVKEILEMC